MSNFRRVLAPGALALAALVATSAMAQERASPPRPGGGGNLPAGSYQRTCRGANLNGNLLSAQCPGPTGAPIMSSLDINGCRGRDIANDKGYLRCSSGGGGPRPPQPPPRPQPPRPVPPRPPAANFQAIAYTLPNYRGQKLVIQGPISDLSSRRGFNDRIRSLTVVRGRPQVCTDAGFRGRCVNVSQSQRDLARIGMANTISSIR
jgi:hypothetical protein